MTVGPSTCVPHGMVLAGAADGGNEMVNSPCAEAFRQVPPTAPGSINCRANKGSRPCSCTAYEVIGMSTSRGAVWDRAKER